MALGNEPGRLSPWIVVVILLRVLFVLAVWIVIFVGMFLGYFTLPLFMLTVVSLVYTLTDAGLLVTIRRRLTGKPLAVRPPERPKGGYDHDE